MLRKLLYAVGTFMYLAIFALGGLSIATLPGMEEFGILVAAIGPTTLSDPGIVKQWRALSQRAYWASLYKSAFSDPQYTGTNKSRRKIEAREDIYGPPIIEYYDLSKMKGDTLTDNVHIPPFDGDEEVLFGSGSDKGYVRVKGQDRVGYEIQASRKNIKFALQSYFFSAFEEDVRMSEQELGGDLLELLVQHTTDLSGRYKDADKLVTFHQGWSPHLYTRIAQADGTISDNDPAPSATEMGVGAPFEHPNTFAFVNEGTTADPVYRLVAANDIADAAATSLTADSWTGKVHEAVGQVDSSALPGRKMLDLIVEQTRYLRLVPIRYRMQNGKSGAYYIMIVSPAMMNMFYDDPDLEKRFGDAYNGMAYKHPLINDDDKMYRNLIIREEEKMAQKMHTFAYCYGDTYQYSVTADGGLDSRTGDGNVDAPGVVVRKDNSDGTGRKLRVYLEYGERTFRSASNGTEAGGEQPAAEDSAIGPNGGDKIDRIILLGASALGTVPGPVFDLDRRQEDDYGNILGIGQEAFSGSRRIEWGTKASNNHNSGYDNQGSMVIAAYNGK